MFSNTEFTLEVFEDRESGETGLKFGNMPDLDMPTAILEGRTLAHDLFEHVNGQEMIGGIADEIMAIGAMWYIRGEYSDIVRGQPSYRSPDEIAAGDLYNIFVDWLRADREWGDHEFDQGYDPTDTYINEIGVEFFQLMVSQYNVEDEAEDEEFTQEELDYYIAYGLKCLCQGYDRAHEKYKDQYMVNSFFWEVAEVASTFIKQTELFCGAEYKLTLDIENLTCNITSMEPWHTLEVEIDDHTECFSVYEDDLDIEQLEYLFSSCEIEDEDDQIAIHEALVSALAFAAEDHQDVTQVGDYSVKYTVSLFTGY